MRSRWGVSIGLTVGALCLAVAAVTLASRAPAGPDPIAGEWPNWPGRVSCGKNAVPFSPPVAFGRTANAERGTLPAEAALRVWLREHRQPGTERRSWRMLSATKTTGDFVRGHLGEESFEEVRLSRVDGGWSAEYVMRPCLLRVRRHGRVATTWSLASDQPLGPSTRAVEINLGSPVECDSNAIEKPEFRRENGALLLTIWVRKLPPTEFDCPEAASWGPGPVRVQLPEPLGHRELLDGGVFPPQPAVAAE